MSLVKIVLLSSALSLGANSVADHKTLEENSFLTSEQEISTLSIPSNYKQVQQDVLDAQQNIAQNNQLDQSIEQLQFAADKGNKDAMYLLANVYDQGEIVDKDPKKSAYYFKNALFSGWSDKEIERLKSSDENINQTTEALDSAILQLPYILANRVNSLAKHGTSSILVGDPALKPDEDIFIGSLSSAIRGIGHYLVSDMTSNR